MAGPTLSSMVVDAVADKDNAREPSIYVNSRLLAANVAEQISIPTGAVYVLLETTADVYFLFGSNPTAAVPTDLDDGSACERIGNSEGKWFKVNAFAKISVISAGAAIVTASFFKS